MPAEGDNNATKRADSNRERKLKARRALDQLLHLAMADDFSGSITVEVTSKDGQLGRISRALKSYEQ